MTSYRWQIDASTASLAKLGEDLRRFFARCTTNSRDAEDLVGQTWLAAGRNFEGRASLRDYLYTVARRLLSNHWTRRCYRPWIHLERDDPETLIDHRASLDRKLASHAELQRLHRAIAQLPQHYARVIELTLLGYGQLEIAELLGINYNTVRSRYNRGTAQLQRLLDR